MPWHQYIACCDVGDLDEEVTARTAVSDVAGPIRDSRVLQDKSHVGLVVHESAFGSTNLPSCGQAVAGVGDARAGHGSLKAGGDVAPLWEVLSRLRSRPVCALPERACDLLRGASAEGARVGAGLGMRGRDVTASRRDCLAGPRTPFHPLECAPRSDPGGPAQTLGAGVDGKADPCLMQTAPCLAQSFHRNEDQDARGAMSCSRALSSHSSHSSQSVFLYVCVGQARRCSKATRSRTDTAGFSSRHAPRRGDIDWTVAAPCIMTELRRKSRGRETFVRWTFSGRLSTTASSRCSSTDITAVGAEARDPCRPPSSRPVRVPASAGTSCAQTPTSRALSQWSAKCSVAKPTIGRCSATAGGPMSWGIGRSEGDAIWGSSRATAPRVSG